MMDETAAPASGADEAVVANAAAGATEMVAGSVGDGAAVQADADVIHDDPIDLLTEERDALQKDLDDAKTALADALALLETRTAERDALQAQIDAAAAAPKAKRAAPAAKARKAGPMDNPKADELIAAIGEADLVELVFSDGKNELAGVAALEVSGNAWAKVIGGVALRLPELLVSGAAEGASGWPLKGYALFLDGKQAAWGPRPETLVLGGGRKFNLREDVIFPAAE